jgi:TPR repeat protein
MRLAIDCRPLVPIQGSTFFEADPPKADPPKADPAKTDPPKQAQVVLSLNSDEIATLIKVAKDFLQRGDIASASVSLKRAALAGNAEAALELGMTFDQAFLAKWGVLGFAADAAQAREWYDRAIKLGSTEAAHYLARLASMPR